MKAIWNRWTHNPFALPLAAMAAILAAAALGFAHMEASTQAEPVGFFEGLWWAVVTLFTVGYGDFAPKTMAGRVMGMAVMASGIGLVSALTGSLASAMVERRLQKRRGLLPVTTKGHVLILGWNGHGATLVERLRQRPELAGAGFVLACDMEPSAFEAVAESLGLGHALEFVRGDTASKAVLERANPSQASLAYILPADGAAPEDADNQSVLTALTFRSLAPRTTLYAEALREESREHLLRAGVTQALGRDELAGKALAFMAAHPVMHDLLLAVMAGGRGAVRYRALTAQEKAGRWPALVAASIQEGGRLPLGVCTLPRELDLADLLDASQALDAYVMDLFKAAGRDAPLGKQGPRLVVNPGQDVDLSGFDGVLYMERAS